MRVTVRLENTADGTQLWTEQYNEELDDVFAVQDDIARAVVDQLQVTLLGAADEPLVRTGTESVEAYNLYLQGRYFWAQRGDGLQRGLNLFEQAVELDPFYARSHAGIADAYQLLGYYGDIDPSEAFPRARAAAERALALDSSLAEPHATLGSIETFYGWDWDAADAHFRRAIALDPEYVPAHYWYAPYLIFARGMLDSGLAEAQRAVSLDPLSAHAAHVASVALGASLRYPEAVAEAQRAVELLPSWVNYQSLGFAYLGAGLLDEAEAAIDSAVVLSNRRPFALGAGGFLYGALGDTARFVELRDEFWALRSERWISPAGMGLFALGLGDRAGVAEWFERALAEHDPNFAYLLSNYRLSVANGLAAPDSLVDAFWMRLRAVTGSEQ